MEQERSRAEVVRNYFQIVIYLSNSALSPCRLFCVGKRDNLRKHPTHSNFTLISTALSLPSTLQPRTCIPFSTVIPILPTDPDAARDHFHTTHGDHCLSNNIFLYGTHRMAAGQVFVGRVESESRSRRGEDRCEECGSELDVRNLYERRI